MAAQESGMEFEIIESYEINTTALDVYRHNFPGTSKAHNIMGLTADHLDKLHPHLIMMSPPCQPFTRQGLKRDVEDSRTSSLLHFLHLLKEVPRTPDMILLENVAGFETSLARERLVEVLDARNYNWQEYLLSPTKFGVPNSRLRYYMLAKQKQSSFLFSPSNKVEAEFPLCLCIRGEKNILEDGEQCSSCSRPVLSVIHDLLQRTYSTHQPTIHSGATTNTQLPLQLCYYMDHTSDMEPYFLKDNILRKYHMILDIVNGESRKSCCFTKGYSHYVEGTGSVIQHNTEVNMSHVYAKVEELSADSPEKLELLRQLQLRYFTPKEVARLMCFPSWFTFPETTTRKQRYRVLGNSVNVLVVTCLLLTLIEG
ncbi:hypothetical protein Pmani_029859 [Petrolisthes manimaculis]|uniref:tRNA (cytosine(38)-C(5))-methyltransferase n=1 Tax=Petrolisthes manimaculis TaxID=1843537 RepID=A0AAE1TWK8_9EUCA|nr:hypothetical protein Pmani_029859 [Petrolisthes manimaculis]